MITYFLLSMLSEAHHKPFKERLSLFLLVAIDRQGRFKSPFGSLLLYW